MYIIDYDLRKIRKVLAKSEEKESVYHLHGTPIYKYWIEYEDDSVCGKAGGYYDDERIYTKREDAVNVLIDFIHEKIGRLEKQIADFENEIRLIK